VDVNAYLRRIPVLWRTRSEARRSFFAALRHVASIDESRQIFSNLLQTQNAAPFPQELSAHRQLQPPYPELCREREEPRGCHRSDVIFITGRFRSGSTLLWNLFRHVPSVTAYYEPFNERRWFDRAARGSHVDPTHLNVSDYWAEYEGLDVLDRYFCAQWKFRHLYMPAYAWNPQMQRYIEMLIDSARGRPVLQFNEVDLRLPWLRARFAQAKILHIFRHPRNQWCSTLGDGVAKAGVRTLRDFASADGFYLLAWGRDLRHYFPFLTLDEGSHPYELFYQLWKLSYLFGRLYADVSIPFEHIVADPDTGVRQLLTDLCVDGYDLGKLVTLVSPIRNDRWRSCADRDSFESIEARVDATLEDYVGIPLVRASSSPRSAE
jgi:hypothetical protein